MNDDEQTNMQINSVSCIGGLDTSCKDMEIFCNYNNGPIEADSYPDLCEMTYNTDLSRWECGDETTCVVPTSSPTTIPSNMPSEIPSFSPTFFPTNTPTNIPTFTPTNNPSLLPSSTPTNIPTGPPTAIPTVPPTFAPTKIPTDQADYPTDVPTGQPTQTPSQQPTTLSLAASASDAPTATPSMNPTVIPTNNPSRNPTTIPTYQPSEHPTSIPTSDPTERIRIVGTAQFSSNFLEIYVWLSVNEGEVSITKVKGENDCSEVFDSVTMLLLSEYSTCDWNYGNQMITISLSSYSTIQITDKLVIESDGLFIDYFGQEEVNEKQVTIESIEIDETNTILPVVELYNFRSEIGLCDDLTLDARNSYNLGMF